MPLPQKLIIDTDPGDDVDDVLALAFALLRPELDVRAITTVTPFPDRRVHIVRKLLALGNATACIKNNSVNERRLLCSADRSVL